MRTKHVSLKDVLLAIDSELVSVQGDTDLPIDNIVDALHVNQTTLDWVNSAREDKQKASEDTVARVVLVDETVRYSEIAQERGKTFVVVRNPKKAIAIVGNAFFADRWQPGIHPSCVIDPGAKIADDATVAPFAHIGRATIGSGTVVCANVRIYDDVVIGDHCFIKEGAVIGGPGFGYEVDDDGNRFRFPQIGGVTIGDHVDIGANTCVDRGALSDTVIEDYAKIDNLCHIAHNVHIGKNAMITACAEVSGSCRVGENSWIGPNSSVRDWRSIGEASTVGIGANVVRDVPENEVWAGNPAKKLG